MKRVRHSDKGFKRKVRPRFARHSDEPVGAQAEAAGHQADVYAGRATAWERFDKALLDEVDGVAGTSGGTGDYYWGPFGSEHEEAPSVVSGSEEASDDDEDWANAETFVVDGHPLAYLGLAEGLDERLGYLARQKRTPGMLLKLVRTAQHSGDPKERAEAERTLGRYLQGETLRLAAIRALERYAITAVEIHADTEEQKRLLGQMLAEEARAHARAQMFASFDQPSSEADFVGSLAHDLTPAQVSARVKKQRLRDWWTYTQWFCSSEASDFREHHGLESELEPVRKLIVPTSFYERLNMRFGGGEHARELTTWVRSLLPSSDPLLDSRGSRIDPRIIRIDDVVLVRSSSSDDEGDGAHMHLAMVVGFRRVEHGHVLVRLRKVHRNLNHGTIRIGVPVPDARARDLEYVQRGVRYVRYETRSGRPKYIAHPYREVDWHQLRERESFHEGARVLRYPSLPIPQVAPPLPPDEAHIRVCAVEELVSLASVGANVKVAVTELRNAEGLRLRVPGVTPVRGDRVPDPAAAVERMRQCGSVQLLVHASSRAHEQPLGCHQPTCPRCAQAGASEDAQKYLPAFLEMAKAGYPIVHLTFTQRIPRTFGRAILLSHEEIRKYPLLVGEPATEVGYTVPGESLGEALDRLTWAWSQMTTDDCRPLKKRWNADFLGGVYGTEFTGMRPLPRGYWLRYHVHRHVLGVLPKGTVLKEGLDHRGELVLRCEWLTRRAEDWIAAGRKAAQRALRQLDGMIPLKVEHEFGTPKRDGVLRPEDLTPDTMGMEGTIVASGTRAVDVEELKRKARETLKYPFKHGTVTEAQCVETLCVLKGRHLHDAFGILSGKGHEARAARALSTRPVPEWKELLNHTEVSPDRLELVKDYAHALRSERDRAREVIEEPGLKGLMFHRRAESREALLPQVPRRKVDGEEFVGTTRGGTMADYAIERDAEKEYIGVALAPAEVSAEQAQRFLKDGGRWYARPPAAGTPLREQDVVARKPHVSGSYLMPAVQLLCDITGSHAYEEVIPEATAGHPAPSPSGDVPEEGTD